MRVWAKLLAWGHRRYLERGRTSICPAANLTSDNPSSWYIRDLRGTKGNASNTICVPIPSGVLAAPVAADPYQLWMHLPLWWWIRAEISFRHGTASSSPGCKTSFIAMAQARHQCYVGHCSPSTYPVRDLTVHQVTCPRLQYCRDLNADLTDKGLGS